MCQIFVDVSEAARFSKSREIFTRLHDVTYQKTIIVTYFTVVDILIFYLVTTSSYLCA
jgi:hypothetical protein